MPQAGRATGLAVWASVVGLAALGTLLPGTAGAQAPKRADPLDEPLRLVARAQAAYAKIKDYSCTLIKRERLEGELSPNNVITLSIRKEPFSVSMVWQEPKASEGQEAVYVTGKYDGKMRVKMGGLLGSIGFVTLALNDPRVRRESRHKLTEAGIGALIDRCAAGWVKERQWKQTQVRVGTFTFAKRKCSRVELTHASRAGGKFRNYRNVVYFDQQTGLPIRVENYDWPEKATDRPPIVEVYSYVNLRLNPKLSDEVFDR
jgi:outer membrane lipoprotein-sorting protein